MAKSGPRPPDTAERSADTRAALIAGAVSALRDAGFAGASAREIARRAGCNQALVFYHFGSVNDLLLAALDEVSQRRLTAYRGLLDQAGSVSGLVESARAIFVEDLAAGHVSVLVEMITGAQSVPGLGEDVARRLVPWRELAETAVRQALAGSPLASLVPAQEVAHGIVAGFLGLELLANLDGDSAAALALFDRALLLAGLIDLSGGLGLLPGRGQS
ncbi:MAG TPA: TetR/AcrR family transcriptional regulator [Streptosporangiaceae bacterium]|jgi:AcrR family transcriptional regulator